ncbi:cyclophilin-like domain-containing protein [Globomyces pollinis-pini]|nr:cyclophilin-like domain-containing protein [Globomyces pollinis-pini]
MSSVYVSQPGTKGKVVLKTSAGDVEIELWPKECPKACRNFVQLCMEGYYDNTLFHRIIPKFIVQGGDPTGTGFGGESIYGKPFADEFHSRLKFNQRGLLAMANTGPDTNTSQFFFTLAAAPSLNGKNTIFGKVVGNTVFNVLNLGELDTDKNDKPIYDAKILSCQILSNPFDDIIPRERKPAQEESSKPIAPTKVKGKKYLNINFNLLSFEKDDIEVKDSESVKIRSSHDVLQSETLSKEKSYDGGHDKSKSTVSDTKKRKEVEENEQEQYDSKMKSKVLEKKLKVVEESKNQTKL